MSLSAGCTCPASGQPWYCHSTTCPIFKGDTPKVEEPAPSIDKAGFTEGQRVTVGRGRNHWVIESFSVAAATGQILAHLKPVVGYTGTTVEVDRLRAVTP